MNIESVERLLRETKKILPNVERKTRLHDDYRSAFLDIYTKLLIIQKLANQENLSIQSKQSCDISGPLVFLYEKTHTYSELEKSLSAINAFFQSQNIPTLSDEESGMFLLRH